jgi:7-cyano-7-deazaguanine tRNA-ribosyltransferase
VVILNAFRFEIHSRDLLARIGKLRTKSGTIETPAFLPVINIAKQPVSPRDLWIDYGCKILITNAYLVSKQWGAIAKKEGIHKLLNFPGVVMTDSGAYQILSYGKVDVSPIDIIHFQEEIRTDIATILDVPTGWRVSKKNAEYTIDETLKRAKELQSLKTCSDISWVGPVQGGRYIDLVAKSAQELSKLPFDIHALGSPTPVMEHYLFDLLADMILTAKMNIPNNRLFHLFGAGHPIMFSLAVALGCDLFDSAAYSLFARKNRYLTESGTARLEKLKYFVCSCPICSNGEPKDLIEMSKDEREKKLTQHNLYVCFAEIRRIKQAIVEGRLWEHLEMRAHAHPAIFQALKHLGKYSKYIEKHSPVVKKRGLFFFSSVGLVRPEVIRYRKRLLERYLPPRDADLLLLLPDFGSRHIKEGEILKNKLVTSCIDLGFQFTKIHFCIYAPPFGVIPSELWDIYPLSQYSYAYPPDYETIVNMSKYMAEYIKIMHFKNVVILIKHGTWQETLSENFTQNYKNSKVSFKVLSFIDFLKEKSINSGEV